MKRLVLFLDGTWNDPSDTTNVTRLRKALAAADAAGVEQLPYYAEGVGNKFLERFRGGVFGFGLSKKIRDAYEWLAKNYEDGDEIFVFGFSRGAFTARSLAGVVAKRGLLDEPGKTMTVDELFDSYRKSKTRKLADGARWVPIKFIGVFDTVGTLGMPAGPIRTKLTRVGQYFHNTNPSVQYHHMYHALAIDEHRPPYAATLWTQYVRHGNAPTPLQKHQTVEQRWFIGAHTDVGGGAKSAGLPLLPAVWMQQCAAGHDLAFSEQLVAGANAHVEPVTDSFGKFLFGLYKLVRRNRRYFRGVGAGPSVVKAGDADSLPINESIDASVFDRYRADAEYRPQNLVEWAAREGVDLDTVVGDHRIGVQL